MLHMLPTFTYYHKGTVVSDPLHITYTILVNKNTNNNHEIIKSAIEKVNILEPDNFYEHWAGSTTWGKGY